VPALAALEGCDLGATAWREVSQAQIDAFADATGDHQWIHVDVERAKADSPFGGPIAHGYLTLALAPVLLPELIDVEGCAQVINAGIDRMRLKQPVPAGSRLRLAASVKSVRIIKGHTAHVTLSLRFEIEGEKKPACIADAIYVYQGATAGDAGEEDDGA
jgi:acyl dehydratase